MTGRGYAGYLDPANTSTRFDAVMQTGGRNSGNGVPYQTEYCLNAGPDGATKLWIEDTGRWFAGQTAARCAPMACCASSTSARRPSSGWPICRASTP